MVTVHGMALEDVVVEMEEVEEMEELVETVGLDLTIIQLGMDPVEQEVAMVAEVAGEEEMAEGEEDVLVELVV